MKRRDFVASRIEDDYQEVNLFVLTNDYKNFALYEEIEKENKKIATFKSKDIDGAINSETKISNFITKLSGYHNAYSLNDFRDV